MVDQTQRLSRYRELIQELNETKKMEIARRTVELFFSFDIVNSSFHSVEDLIDGKMICGAGGGGFLQVVLKKGVTQEDVRKRLREVFQDSGVDVWSCSLA